jgi:hypothetical protein
MNNKRKMKKKNNKKIKNITMANLSAKKTKKQKNFYHRLIVLPWGPSL